jgi:hypothetical protein
MPLYVALGKMESENGRYSLYSQHMFQLSSFYKRFLFKMRVEARSTNQLDIWIKMNLNTKIGKQQSTISMYIQYNVIQKLCNTIYYNVFKNNSKIFEKTNVKTKILFFVVLSSLSYEPFIA